MSLLASAGNIHISSSYSSKSVHDLSRIGPLSKTVRFNALKVIPAGLSGGGSKEGIHRYVSLAHYHFLRRLCYILIVHNVLDRTVTCLGVFLSCTIRKSSLSSVFLYVHSKFVIIGLPLGILHHDWLVEISIPGRLEHLYRMV